MARFIIQEDLKKYGPKSMPAQTIASAEARRYCHTLATSHYENFPVLSWAVPRPLRQHFANIYAYCRWSDDLGDEIDSPDESEQLLSWWRDELNHCYQKQVRHPVFIALSETIEQFSIPIDPFMALLDAFVQDQRIHRYENFDALLGYCEKSANPVGHLILYVCDCYNEEHAGWSDNICTGLQLANFWQDVKRDYRMGRIYLPAEDCKQLGCDIEALQTGTATAEFRQLLQFEVDRTRRMLQAGQPLIDKLPGRISILIDLFRQGGLKVLQRIELLDYDVWQTRPVITRTDKLCLMAGSVARFMGRNLPGWRSSGRAATIGQTEVTPRNPEAKR